MLKSLSEKNSEPYLDGLRGLAALMVLAHHTIIYQDRPYSIPDIRTSLDYGFYGVSLFFIVSAFTLMRSWQLRKNQETTPILSFYIRRCFRILPFWWLNVLLSIYRLSPAPHVLIANFLMYFPFFPFDPSYLIVPYGWSVGVEETFYVLFPLWVVLTKRYWSLAGLLIFFLWAADYWFTHVPYFFPNAQIPEYYFTFPIARYFCFFIGLLVYKISVDPLYLFYSQKCPRFILISIELFLLFVLCKMPSFNEPSMLFFLSLLLLVAGNTKGLLNKLLRMPLFSQVGICCYSFYLLHFYPLEFLRYIKPWLTHPLTQITGEAEFLILFVVAGSISFVLSVLSFLIVERPSVLMGRACLNYLHRTKTFASVDRLK